MQMHPIFMVGRLSIVKMALLSKAIWISNAIPTKILMASFFGGGGNGKANSQIHMEL